MPLPGGILVDGERRRDFAFKSVTGAMQLVLAEIEAATQSLPALVTEVLAATLDHVGGAVPHPDTVAGLCVADRQVLMRRLAVLLGRGESWLTFRCGVCGERFDFAVSHGDLPVKEAGEGYPFAYVGTSIGHCRFRVPTGTDQEAVAAVEDEADAVRALVTRCFAGFSDGDGGEAGPERFTDQDVERIEAALEAVAPEAATVVQSVCPDCGAVQLIEVDPYTALSVQPLEELYQEIHLIASAYHWSEAEILALPLGRRRRYLQLIDRARGMSS